jgi:hypothetical protein
MPEFPDDLSGDGLRLRKLTHRDADDLVSIRSNLEARRWVDRPSSSVSGRTP